MLDVLNNYLAEATTPELKETLEQAHELFERIELPNYEQGFEELLALDDTVEPGDTVKAVVSLTRALQSQILAEHGVVLTQDASVELHNQFIEGILSIGDYEDAQAILQICQMEGLPNELFAELMALVTPMSVDEQLVNIDSVAESFISAVTRHATQQLQASTPGLDQDISAYVERIVRFCNYIGTRNLLLVQAISAGLGLGLPFASYLNIVGRDLEGMSVDKISHELIAMALVSHDGHETPQMVIKEHLESVISDPDFITKIDVRISDLLLGLQK